jgi:hypothetical protein
MTAGAVRPLCIQELDRVSERGERDRESESGGRADTRMLRFLKPSGTATVDQRSKIPNKMFSPELVVQSRIQKTKTKTSDSQTLSQTKTKNKNKNIYLQYCADEL